MRRFLSVIIASLYTVFYVLSPVLFAQVANEDMFELIIPASARANEAFDVTVKALKADGTTNTAYAGSIAFEVLKTGSTESVVGATFPANIDDTVPDIDCKNNPNNIGEYCFKPEDQGQHTFPKGFKFSQAGSYDISVIDTETMQVVTKTITITPGDAGTGSTSAVITIENPVADTTVNSDSVAVSGSTKPTSTVNFFLGVNKVANTISNTEGEFSVNISGLLEGSNTIKAEVVDGAGAVVGSTTVVVKYSLDAPKIESLSVKEGQQVFAGSTVHLEAVGDPGLKTVVVQFGNTPVILTEDTTRPGLYSGNVQLSSFEGEIKPTVNVESFQGTKASFSDLLSINVISSSFENVKVEATPDKKARFTFSLKEDLEEIVYFKIKYGKRSGEYDSEAVTYQKNTIKQGEQYSWYIPGIDQGEYYATIIALDKDKKELPMNSGEQTFTLLNSAETCYIDKVSGVTVKKSGSKSIISWDKLEDAASYQIFKKDAEGEFTMIDEVKDTKYTVNIDMSLEEDVFEDFQIRATCKNGNITGEGAYSESVAVQTGPAAVAFMMLVIASGTAFILMRRGYLR